MDYSSFFNQTVDLISAENSFFYFLGRNMIPAVATNLGSCATITSSSHVFLSLSLSLSGVFLWGVTCYLAWQPSDALSLLHKSISKLMFAYKRRHTNAHRD